MSNIDPDSDPILSALYGALNMEGPAKAAARHLKAFEGMDCSEFDRVRAAIEHRETELSVSALGPFELAERGRRLAQLGERVLEILNKRYPIAPQPGWPEGSDGPTGKAQLAFSSPGEDILAAARSLGLLGDDQ